MLDIHVYSVGCQFFQFNAATQLPSKLVDNGSAGKRSTPLEKSIRTQQHFPIS